MKKDIHPDNYRDVVFHDNPSGVDFLVPSTAQTEETTMYEGKEYPLVKLDATSASHPVYTGQDISLDTTGRAEKFRARAAKATKNKKA